MDGWIDIDDLLRFCVYGIYADIPLDDFISINIGSDCMAMYQTSTKRGK